ncbi:hypothetical protein IQ277_33475 [Nostocales cyanobacterium LEGE 12452]|nr:hypothetical protein [Nostocales cyanobacterium LEGE 12452]
MPTHPQRKFYTNFQCRVRATRFDCYRINSDRTLTLPETATGRSHKQPLQLAKFDKQVALEALCQG